MATGGKHTNSSRLKRIYCAVVPYLAFVAVYGLFAWLFVLTGGSGFVLLAAGVLSGHLARLLPADLAGASEERVLVSVRRLRSP